MLPIRALRLAVITGLILAPGLALASSAGDLLYQRALMSAAGARCGLFTPAVSTALAASAQQARGAALRAGDSDGTLQATVQRAQAKAAITPCSSRDLGVAADNVRAAFAGFAQQLRQTYPGDLSIWTADKLNPAWILYEPGSMGADKMTFGYPVGSNALTAVASFADGRTPYAATLVLRDPTRTQGPYLNRSLAPTGGKLPYAARLAPASVSESFLAASRTAATVALLPPGSKTAWCFTFSPAAAQALAALDPREAVSVQFLFSDGAGGESRRTAYIEVGDFAAGRAFIAAGA